MKISVHSKKIICTNPYSAHKYFAWPTVTRLKNGRLALVASGFRLAHGGAFGKTVISFSEDEGETWSLPAPVIDTILDDRDGGITAFGESSLIVTSFNMPTDYSRNLTEALGVYGEDRSPEKVAAAKAYANSYEDMVECCFNWEEHMGTNYRISHDNGISFGELVQSPVTAPHGPIEMPDGTLLYIGRNYDPTNTYQGTHLHCYKIYADGTYEFVSEIENVGDGFWGCEPHAIRLDDGKILVHIRVQDPAAEEKFTIYQCESYDDGKCFTKPHQVLSDKGGSPAHLICQEGTVISVYGYRQYPYGIRAMFSQDKGETWDFDNVLVDDGPSWDLGYPASVVLEDGKILTVYYASPDNNSPSAIFQIIWSYEEE